MRKTPTKIKKLQGTLNVTRANPDEVEFKTLDGIPNPPDDITGKARDQWFVSCEQLLAVGLLREVDLPQLIMYCRNFQIQEECAAKIAVEGLTTIITNKGGGSYAVPSPYFKMMNEAGAVISRIAARFGFDPVSSSNVSAPKQHKEKDPMSEAA